MIRSTTIAAAALVILATSAHAGWKPKGFVGSSVTIVEIPDSDKEEQLGIEEQERRDRCASALVYNPISVPPRGSALEATRKATQLRIQLRRIAKTKAAMDKAFAEAKPWTSEPTDKPAKKEGKQGEAAMAVLAGEILHWEAVAKLRYAEERQRGETWPDASRALYTGDCAGLPGYAPAATGEWNSPSDG